MVAAPGKYDLSALCYGFQKDSPLKDMFDYHLAKMFEKGTIDKILAKYEPLPQQCPDNAGQALGMESCFTAVGVFVLGIIISGILFIVESLCKCSAMSKITKWYEAPVQPSST